MAEYNYKTLTELNEFTGNVSLTDQILISRAENNDDSNYVSYHSSVNSLTAAISAAIINLDTFKEYVYSGLSNLAFLNHYQLEANSTNPLTSYVSCGNAGSLNADELYAISAIQWDNNKKITNVKGINLKALSASILEDVSDMFKDKGLYYGIVFTDHTNNKGTLLATINDNKIYSGDPKLQIKTEKLAYDGTPIAKITYSNSEEIVIQNDLTAKTINPDFGNYCGDRIAEISGIVLRNNLSVTTKTQSGQCIANINGKDLYNGLSVSSVSKGQTIASINGIEIKNGVDVIDASTTGKKICTINDKDIYNNVDFTDKTNKYGDVIAIVNGNEVYNNVNIKEVNSQIYINDKKILKESDVNVKDITPVTQSGDKIATVTTNSESISLYNGISYTNILQKVYPVGSIYLTVGNSNPATIFGFGTWVQVSQGCCLWGTQTSDFSSAGKTIQAGLPKPSLSRETVLYRGSQSSSSAIGGSGAGKAYTDNIEILDDDIYGKSTTVQPPAFQVNIWQRKA